MSFVAWHSGDRAGRPILHEQGHVGPGGLPELPGGGVDTCKGGGLAEGSAHRPSGGPPPDGRWCAVPQAPTPARTMDFHNEFVSKIPQQLFKKVWHARVWHMYFLLIQTKKISLR